MIRLGNNEVLITLTKTLTFVDAEANTAAEGSTIALCEQCSGKPKIKYKNNVLFWREVRIMSMFCAKKKIKVTLESSMGNYFCFLL